MGIEDLLKEAMDKLDKLSIRANDELENLEDESKRYLESNKEVLESTVEEDEKDLMDVITSIEKNEPYVEKIQELMKEIAWNQAMIEEILEFKESESNPIPFMFLVNKLKNIPAEEFLNKIREASELYEKKYTLTDRDILQVNLKFEEAIKMLNKSKDNGAIFSHKAKVIRDIQNIVRPTLTFFNRTETYLDSVDNFLCNDITKDSKISEQAEQLEKRKAEIQDRINEYNTKIEKAKTNISEVEAAYKLYDEYEETRDQNKLNALLLKLVAFKLVTQRDIKKITYEKAEKITPVVEEKKVEIPVVEEVKTVPTKQETDTPFFPEEESDYFRWPTTEKIICFLGPDDDTIINDINNEFDKSARPIVYDKLIELFERLRNENENKNIQASKPHKGTDRRALVLLENPFDFTYRRYGTGRDPYRIHAIERHSKLLEKLGYGKGDIIFFGAAGLNVAEEKADSYNRLGKRAVHELDIPVKLRSNFNYIEHITRGYIPVELLSDEDKREYNLGRFNSKMKGGKQKAIEGNKFIHYEALDEKTMVKVKNWLFDYFLKQTSMMVDVYKELADLKGNSLD